MEPLSTHHATLTLPSDTEIVIVRDFAAPRGIVFDAWSRPELIRQWYGCPEMSVPVCDVDFRVGGHWRVVLRDSSGDHAMSGEYQAIAPPERLVFTERYERVAAPPHVVTLTLSEHGVGTRLVMHFRHRSPEARNGHLQSGMDTGLEFMFTRLEALAGSMATTAR
jgi:uncharacterized protein YndB with AHSA1/START domain